MTLRFKYVKGQENIENERLVFCVDEDSDVGNFCLLVSKTIRNSDGDESIPTSGKKQAYWFESKDVNKGDLVIVYTKRGRSITKTNKDGFKSHFFYWGLSNAIWNNAELGVVVLESYDWSTWTVT